MSRRFKVAVLAAAVGSAIGLSVAVPAANAGSPGVARLTLKQTRLDWTPRRTAAQVAALRAQPLAGTPIQDFSRTINDGGTNFTFTMIGKNPFVAQTKPSTTIKTYLQPIKFHFTADGRNWDPTVADTCDPGASALTRTQQSPIFNAQGWKFGGTSVGKAQYVDAFQRASFFNQTKSTGINPGYHVKLSLITLPLFTVNVSGTAAAEYNMGCGNGRLGGVDINAWDSFVQSTLLPNMATQGLTKKDLPLFLFGNVVLFDTSPGNCCILGYHNAIGSGAASRATASRCTTARASSPARRTSRRSATRSRSG
jgi:hypothetical protein